MSAVASQLSAAMREYIPLAGKKPLRTFGQKTALFSKLYRNRRDYDGGYNASQGDIRVGTIDYRPMPGGPHRKGGTFTNQNVDTSQPVFLSIKLFEVTVVINKVDHRVFNRGKDALFSMLENKVSNAMKSLGIYVDIGAYLPGQGASYTTNFSGLSEICNDGTTAPAVGAATTTYGGLSRSNNDYGYAVKGKTTALAGALTHRALLKSLKDVTIDGEGPKFGLTTPDCVVYVEDRFQPQQRFSGQVATDIGIPGWKFHNQVVFESRYVPGNWISGASATSGENRIAYEYVNRMSTEAGSPLTAYPTVAGETWYWVNDDPDYLGCYVSTDPIFNFGFDDFVGDRDDDDLVGRFRLAALMYGLDNRRQAEINDIRI